MLIVITDEGRIWNHNEPILERYADDVLVVCLNGEAVTEKYRCFVSPCEKTEDRKEHNKGITGNKFRALESVADELMSIFDQHEDVVFLTDAEPNSLFPYQAVRNMKRTARFHLWCMLPFPFEGKIRRFLYKGLIDDFGAFKSVICFEDKFYRTHPKHDRSLITVFDTISSIARRELPRVLYYIGNKMKSESSYYYDFECRRYIKVDDPYEDIMRHAKNKQAVEKLYPRINGKDICDQLKQMRRMLAEANGIELKSVDCPSTGSCAGTCTRCDDEILDLQHQLEKIPYDKRVYPEFSVEDICNEFKELKPISEEELDDIFVLLPGIFTHS